VTRFQQTRYRKELWPAACVAQGWHLLPAAEQEAKRRAVTLEASKGRTDTTADLNTTDQCDALFRKLEALARPDDLTAVARDLDIVREKIDGDRRRLLHVIAQLGFEDAYVQRIAAWDCRECQVSDWKRLPVVLKGPKSAGLRRVLVHLTKRRHEKENAAGRDQVRVYQMRPRRKFQPREVAA
jgi:hypothetical protein